MGFLAGELRSSYIRRGWSPLHPGWYFWFACPPLQLIARRINKWFNILYL